jgi:hypothetical protein
MNTYFFIINHLESHKRIRREQIKIREAKAKRLMNEEKKRLKEEAKKTKEKEKESVKKGMGDRQIQKEEGLVEDALAQLRDGEVWEKKRQARRESESPLYFIHNYM